MNKRIRGWIVWLLVAVMLTGLAPWTSQGAWAASEPVIHTLTDEFTDWSKTQFHTPGMAFEPGKETELGNAGLIKIGSAAAGAHLIYALPGPVQSFDLNTYRLKSAAASVLKFYTSADGVAYQEVAAAETIVKDATWQQVAYRTSAVPADSVFLKIVYSSKPNGYNPYLGAIQIQYAAPADPGLPPVTQDDQVEYLPNTPVAGKVKASDPEGGPLQYSLKTPPVQGTVTLSVYGEWTYTPNQGAKQNDSFQVEVKDEQANRATATIELLSAAAGLTPLGDISVSTQVNQPLGSQLRFADDQGRPYSYAVLNQPSHGSLTLNVYGQYTYSPAAGYLGRDTFTVTATDAEGAKVQATVSVTVDQAIFDELEDFSKLYRYTPGLVFGDKTKPNEYDYDLTRVAMGSAPAGASMVYKTTIDMSEFIINTHAQRSKAASELKFFVSPDDVTYTEITPRKTDVGKIGWAHFALYAYEGENLPAGTRFLKIVFTTKPSTVQADPQIAKVFINDTKSITYDPAYNGVTPQEAIAILREKHPNKQHPRLMVTPEEMALKRELYGEDDFLTRIRIL
ncbi:hypothetical protein SY83_03075 [Paenibacillus swuensis]|uniref:Cadherin domain-containing protein n=1 Tax=Paenibacillus swuensis TaxID=1178515 RepID=A0A172TEK6_9BACL|nr:Ig-like domain-containing protein [Paenibacillus swuensis]ANE45471.1 hypothetical protein SY83_03075 [Paenibacillus swuensis]